MPGYDASIVLSSNALNDAIDWPELRREYQGFLDEVCELARDFPDRADELMTLIETNMRTHDSQGVALHLHSLKGTCQLFRPTRLARVCQELEDAGHGADWSAFEAKFVVLQGELKRFLEALHQIDRCMKPSAEIRGHIT